MKSIKIQNQKKNAKIVQIELPFRYRTDPKLSTKIDRSTELDI